MPMFGKIVILGLCLTVSAAFGQQGERIDIGNLQTGATVSFVRNAVGLEELDPVLFQQLSKGN